jgi:hypothetical protein
MNVKICTKCKTEKPETCFQFRNKKKGQRHSVCTECGRFYRRTHYKNNKIYYKKKARKRGKEVVRENHIKIIEYLKLHPCVDCGEKDILVLQFDHVRGIKRTEVSILYNCGYSWNTVEQEIAKCEVRCANCHQRKTVKQLGYYRGLVD